jgi:hypothetical protein
VTLSIGEPREFTANGTGLAGVEWSAPGGTPAAGTGPTFTTQWAEAGEKTLTATCGGHAGDSTATVTVTTATQPPNDATPLTVDIRAEGVGMPLCRILAIGKSRKYRAVVAPAGGTIVWTCTGGASIVGSASAELVTVKGDTVSTTVDDVVLTLVYLRGLSSQSQEIKLTVADVTKIAVHVKASAAMTPGRGAALADHQFDCKETVEDFPPHKSLILLRGDFEDIELQATVNPTGTPLAWDVKRASDDAAALGHGLPTLTPNRADNTKANLKQNETGSFFVRAYGDCGDQKFDANAPFKLVPAVLVQATLQRDATEAHPRNLAEIDQTGTFVNVDSGIAQKIVRDSAGELIFDNPSLAAFHHKAYVHVVSGGEKGRLLIEHVYAGWVQDIVADVDWFGSYTAEGLSNAHSFTTVFATNDGTGPVGTVDIYGKKHRIFLPGEVPNLVATPLLDTLRLKNPGTGGVRATMLNSLPPLRRPPPKDGDLKDLGELWIVQSVDSPGTQFPLLHPVFTTAAHPVRLEGIHFELHFRANLCLWTNRSGAVGGVAENSYGVLHSFNWDMHAVWSIDAANKPPTVRSEMSIPISGRVTRNDALAKPKNAACEVYGPAGLALLRARAER